MTVRLLPISIVACATAYPWGHARVATTAPDARVVEITASRTAFTPSRIEVTVGELVRLRFTRTTSNGCAREVVLSLDGDHQISRELPVNVPIDLVLQFDRAGELGFSCGMAMLGGTIVIREKL